MITKAPRPTDNDLIRAAAWLRCNDGEEGEAEACEATAAWIEDMVADKVIRDAARAAGIPIAKVRQRLADNMRKGQT